ncbi:TetR family transcriptional regulator [Rheinheimera muenzenbergensis]|uniref:TetR family transcriptional regulator n=1 Tax=Rheinheimera muenzenbergensis TaxID=1193628 RepID=A0ABU8CAP4_9GAMM
MANASGRPLSADDTQSRERLLNAARGQFSKRGYAATTTRDIARLAGTNPALIRYYFNNKAGLFQAVLHETIQPMLSLMRSAPLQSEKPDMLALVQQYHRMMAPHPELPRMIFRALHNPASAEYQIVSDTFNGVIRTAVEHLLAQLAKSAGQASETKRQALVISALALAVFPFLMPDVVRQILQFSATPDELAAIASCAAPLFATKVTDTAGGQRG